MPDFSIILPAYRSAAFIETTIGSVLAQSDPDFELIVIDDGSPDNTADIVRAIPDSRIRLLSRPNGGIAAARNTGIEAATGRWIAFLDHDDFWHPDKLRTQRAVFEAQPDVGVVYGEFLGWDPANPPVFPDAPLDAAALSARLSGYIYHELLLTNWVLFTTAVFKREVFTRIGLFDPALPPADDWDVALRASVHFKFAKLEQPVALYRQHAGQTSRKPDVRDLEGDMRRRFMGEYGTTSPDGRQTDAQELKRRMVRSAYNYGVGRVQCGDFARARPALWSAWCQQPTHWRALALFGMSVLGLGAKTPKP